MEQEQIVGASSTVPAVDQEAIFKIYSHVIRRNFRPIVLFALLSAIVTALAVYAIAPTYVGDVTIMIEAQESKVVSIEEVYGLSAGRNEYFLTQFEILKSRDLAEKVVRKLKLDETLEYSQSAGSSWLKTLKGYFKPAVEKSTDDRIKDATIEFQSRLSVKPVRSTYLVKARFESQDPLLAAAGANQLAQTYIENNLESRLQMTRMAVGWLTERLSGLRDKMEESEKKLQIYREKENLIELEGVKTLISKELTDIAGGIAEARNKSSELASISAQVDARPGDYSSVPAVLRNPLVQNFKEQEGALERSLSELSKRYGQQHPAIVAAKTELQGARENTNQQIAKVIQGIRNESLAAKATEESLLKEMVKLKDKLQAINRKEYELKDFEREVAVNTQLYDTFFNRIKEASETGDLLTAHARVVDVAVVPTEPVSPRKGMLIAMAFLVALGFGIIAAVIKESLGNTVNNRDDVVLKLGAQMLGLLQLLDRKKVAGSTSMIYVNEPKSSFSESIRTIRTGIVLSGLDKPHKVIVVTSSIPGEGKTTVSSNIASALGQMEKVLLIDADMRRPSIATNLGLSLSAPGLSNLVAGTNELSECITHMDAMGIDVITAGIIPPNPLDLLSSKRFSAMLEFLCAKYDRIVIDSAPAEVVSDPLVLSTMANAVIYVIKADSTPVKSIRSGIGRLRAIHAPLIGVVLNQLDVAQGSRYGKYYGGYYDYYGYSSGNYKY